MRRRLLILGIALALLLALGGEASAADPEPGTITTYAGTGVGDGGLATGASLHHPWSVVVDSSGNLYIADTHNQRIRDVNTSGVIATMAGTGSPGYSGEGGLASEAEVCDPASLALDSSGNLYIADTYNHRIRMVDTSGVITTVAGSGTACGTLGDGGPATAASLCGPKGVAVDASGNLYIADTHNHRIRKVDTSGTIATVAGNGIPGYSGDDDLATSAELNLPVDVTVDASGNLYIADADNHRVRKVDSGADGVVNGGLDENITTVAGNGSPGYSGEGSPATSASLYHPYGVVVDTSGNLYIADTGNNRIRKVDTLDTITTVAGNGTAGYSGDNDPATSAELNFPVGVALDTSGNLYIADYWNNRARKVDTLGVITTVAGNGTLGYSGDGDLATGAGLNLPAGVTVDRWGRLYIADYANNRIRRVDVSGIIATVAGDGDASYSGDDGPATDASLHYPSAVAVDSYGSLSIADAATPRNRRVAPGADGVVNGGLGENITTVAGDGSAGYSGDDVPATDASLHYPYGVAVDSLGNLYIADTNNHRIRKVDTSGIITSVAGGGGGCTEPCPATDASLYYPSSVGLDRSGNLYIADTNNHRVRKVDTSGTITTVAGGGGGCAEPCPATSASLNTPWGVVLNSWGDLYIADSGNHRVRKVDTSGTITTVAGSGEYDYSGDGGPAAEAGLKYPRDTALDSSGNLYIADQRNDRIRKVASVSPPAPIGGVAEFPPVEPETAVDGLARSAPSPLALAGVAAGAAVLLAVGAWYTRTRWQG